ncbi:hypothetical protein MCHIJ_17590 [Mycolicibacterium chitae]|uniref:IclR family transcriptional regulator n=1 Tax=Mycolicibacterium chitae TaxID=1792 RepID=A0A3S4VD11_MYCCI|nr:HNH endonuclease signature motif containing protein [Mycolicibacterium chitae]MCV7109021.1 DUF222 domain-containing protein [Mycolicibacterium chitae]BBZ02322.1 hypothetical protein MCHIJ_17590 [Mycolicibacterium chitae]VEG44681.1 IclR family transcriptional regulator [Mycolicibacterium chitae]
MSSIAPAAPAEMHGDARIEVLFEELAELTGQRNAIDGRLVDIIAEIDHDGLWGNTGARSLPALIAWKTGLTPNNAATLAAVAHRRDEFPQCTQYLRDGRLSLDQVGVIAERAADGSDAHYAQLAPYATVSQLRTAIKLAPRPEPAPGPAPPPAITRTDRGDHIDYRLRLSPLAAATFDAALQSHHDALITDWKRDQDTAPADNGAPDDAGDPGRPPMPTNLDAFLRLVEDSWDAEATRRPHGQRTTLVVHLDLNQRLADLHLGPLLTDSDHHYLTCDATAEIWFERDGRPLGAGRSTRTIGRRLRRALERRDKHCVVPGSAATRGLHAHHLIHWEHGGPTELHNLVLVCPYHHRAHHNGLITLTGPADHLIVTNPDDQPLHPGSLARPPQNPPPHVSPCPGPTGERADWWWYDPYQPQPPPNTN